MGRIIKGKKAVFEEYEDALFRGTICVEGEAKGEKIKEEIFIRCPKIPQELFGRAVSFLDWCFEKHKSEGMLYFIYRQDPFEEAKGTWELACPIQYNTGARVCAHAEKEPALFADAVGDIHSHPAMGWSGHSGTDAHDEKQHNHGIYMVLSWKHGGHPHVKGDVTIYGYVRGRRITIKMTQMIDYSGAPPDGSFPEEWKAKVHEGTCEVCPKFEFPASHGSGAVSESEWMRKYMSGRGFGRGFDPAKYREEEGFRGNEEWRE